MMDLALVALLFVAGGLWEQYVKYILAERWSLKGRLAFRLGYFLEVAGYFPFGAYTLYRIFATWAIPRAAPWQLGVGVVLIAAGIAINYRAVKDLKLARWNSAHLYGVNPELGQLVETGVYGRIRHPSYTGQILALAGCACVVPSPYIVVFAATFAVYTMAVHVPIEEHFLVRRLGPVYQDYRRRVPAFLPLRLRL